MMLFIIISTVYSVGVKTFGNTGTVTFDRVDNITFYEESWLEFDGVNDKVNRTRLTELSKSNNFSVVMWIKLKSLGTQSILGNTVNSNDRFAIRLLSGVLRAGVYDGASYTSKAGNYGSNDWTMITSVYNTTNMDIYFNKSEKGVTGSNPSAGSEQVLTIGSKTSFTENINGSIDQVLILDSLLIQQQINTLYDESRFIDDKGIRIPQIVYHEIDNVPGGWNGITSIYNFTRQMQYLNDSGFTTITFKNYYDWKYNNNYTIPDKPIIIGFDDGMKNVIVNATPIMDTFNFKGVVNIISEDVGTSKRMTYADLVTLANNDWEIASHSFNHTRFTNGSQPEAARIKQYNQSKNDIEAGMLAAGLAYNIKTFVYPYNVQNPGNRTECLNFYTGCSGNSSFDNTNYDYYMYKEDLMVNEGMRRMTIHDDTTYARYKQMVNIEDGLIAHYKLNKNTGIIANDSSSNNYDATIDGAIWNSSRYGFNVTCGSETEFYNVSSGQNFLLDECISQCVWPINGLNRNNQLCSGNYPNIIDVNRSQPVFNYLISEDVYLNFTINETSTSGHIINLSNNAIRTFTYNGRKDLVIVNNTVTVNSVMPLPDNNIIPPQMSEYSFSSSDRNLKISCTGLTNFNISGLSVIRSPDGFYNVLYNNRFQEKSSADIYTFATCSDWELTGNELSLSMSDRTSYNILTILVGLFVAIAVLAITLLAIINWQRWTLKDYIKWMLFSLIGIILASILLVIVFNV